MNELNKMLVHAAANGNAAKVELLLALGADPKANDSWALLWAARCGHTDCVKLLIPVSVSDPKACNSSALSAAAYYGHTDCAKLIQEAIDERAR